MKRKTQFRIGLVITLVMTLISIALGPISNALPLPLPWRNITWPLFIGVAVLLLICAATLWVISNRTDASLNATERRNLLTRLQSHYRNQRRPLLDAIDRSEYRDNHQREERFLMLTLCKQPAAITISRQQQASAKRDGQRPSCFPSTDLLKEYDDAGTQLLILGEPGSGKTMLLYELADHLLKRAQQNREESIPIVFNLSSWAIKQLPLTEWLVETLGQEYKKVTEKFADPAFAQRQVDDREIIPLLDGLDEVPEKCQRACIEAINTYLSLEKNDLKSVVVCSRTSDFLAQNIPGQNTLLRLQSTVVVQPLTPQQVYQYIADMKQLGMHLEGLLQALPHDQELQGLATIPLMLHVLTHAYNGVPVEQFRAAGSPTKRQQQVFETYVNRMLDRRNTRHHYPPPQARRYLQCLAQQIMYCNLAEFRVEQIEPEWLPPDHRAQQMYYSLAVRLVVEVPFLARSVVLWALLIGLAFPVISAIIGGLMGGLHGLVSGYINTLPFTFIGGGIVGVMREAYNVSTGEGGADQRFPFRQALQYSGYLRFLDDATACLLLHKGQEGRYAFIHRLLLEYFATLHAAPIPAQITTSVYDAQGRFTADKVLEIVRRQQYPPEWEILPGDRPLLPGCFTTLKYGMSLFIPLGSLGGLQTSSWHGLHGLVLSSIVIIWLTLPLVVAFCKLQRAKRHAQLPATVIITPFGVVDYKDAKHMQTIDFARVTHLEGQRRKQQNGATSEYLSIDYVDRTHEDYFGLQTRYRLAKLTSDIQYTGGIILPRYQPTRRDLCAICNAYDPIFKRRLSALSAYFKKNVSDTTI